MGQPDPPPLKKLTYKWPGNSNTFSFDLGGSFIGQGDDDSKTREGENFFAEVKKSYSSASEPNCPCSLIFWQKLLRKPEKENPKFTDIFYGLPGPIRVTKWSQLHSPEEIKEAILKQEKSVEISEYFRYSRSR